METLKETYQDQCTSPGGFQSRAPSLSQPPPPSLPSPSHLCPPPSHPPPPAYLHSCHYLIHLNFTRTVRPRLSSCLPKHHSTTKRLLAVHSKPATSLRWLMIMMKGFNHVCRINNLRLTSFELHIIINKPRRYDLKV